MEKSVRDADGFKMRSLLRPHLRLLVIGFVAVIGEGAANLLEPWPLKIVLDNVLRSKPAQGWLNTWILSNFGHDKLGVLNFAALAVLAIAIVGAGCSYVEKHVTTTVGQWVTHDLRRTLGSWQAKTGASLVVIGKSLNHRNVTTTAIYARLDKDPVRESVAYSSTHIPMAATPPGFPRRSVPERVALRPNRISPAPTSPAAQASWRSSAG